MRINDISEDRRLNWSSMRDHIRIIEIASLLLILLGCVGVSADNKAYPDSLDWFINSLQPTQSFKGLEYLEVSRNLSTDPVNESRAILLFELSGIPRYSYINSATLVLKTYEVSGELDIEVWEVDGNPEILCSSWLSMNCDRNWVSPGGDLIKLWANATTSSSEVTINLTDYVQAYVDGELTNQEHPGYLLIKLRDGEEGYFRFFSEESHGNEPVLQVDYNPPSLNLTLSSHDVLVKQGESVNLTVYVAGSMSKPVNLTLEGPNFLEYNFTVQSSIPPFTSVLSLQIPENATGGTYTVGISAENVLDLPAEDFLNLTVVESRGFLLSSPNSVEIKGGFVYSFPINIEPTGNFTGEVSAGILSSPDWLHVSIDPPSGNPPFSVNVTLWSDPGVNASGSLRLIFHGANLNRILEVNVTTVRRLVAVYSNEIDWGLSREALLGPANTSGVPLIRVNSSDRFSEFDLVIILGGHKAPTDSYMPENMADSILPQAKKQALLEKGGKVVYAKREGDTWIIVVAGSDRYVTAELISSDEDGNGKTLAEELITGDPSGI